MKVKQHFHPPGYPVADEKITNLKKFGFNTNINDLSIGSTKTKYIKLNTKTQNIFCFVNENLTTFYTL